MTLFHWLKFKYIQIRFFEKQKKHEKFVKRIEQILRRLVKNFLKTILFKSNLFKFIFLGNKKYDFCKNDINQLIVVYMAVAY
jgi:hypothetical protein